VPDLKLENFLLMSLWS